MAYSPNNALYGFRIKILKTAGNEVYPESGKNLPKEFESIENREEYKNKVLYDFIKSEWKRINDVLKERIPERPDGIPKELLIRELSKKLSENDRQNTCPNIPSDVISEIETKYISELRQPGVTIGGSIIKRKYNSSSTSTRRRRPRRGKSTSTKPRRRPHRRTSRK
jgi:hypothetical protein